MAVNNEQKMVREYHEAFGHPVGTTPERIDPIRAEIRKEWTLDEVFELEDAILADDIVEVADALADIIYFCYGTAVEYGIDLEPVFEEVHQSNMAKLFPDGKPRSRQDGKTIKPEGWLPPDIARVLREQGWGE